MAANAASAIAGLGGKAELWSRVGGDEAGMRIRAGLKSAGVTCATSRRRRSAVFDFGSDRGCRG